MIRHLLTALYVREALLGMALAVAGGGAVYGAGEGIWAIPSVRAFVLRTEPLRVSSVPASIAIAGDN